MTKTEKTTITLSFSPKAMDLLEGLAKANEESSAKAYVLSMIRLRVEADLEFFEADICDSDELFGNSEAVEKEARA